MSLLNLLNKKIINKGLWEGNIKPFSFNPIFNYGHIKTVNELKSQLSDCLNIRDDYKTIYKMWSREINFSQLDSLKESIGLMEPGSSTSIILPIQRPVFNRGNPNFHVPEYEDIGIDLHLKIYKMSGEFFNVSGEFKNK